MPDVSAFPPLNQFVTESQLEVSKFGGFGRSLTEETVGFGIPKEKGKLATDRHPQS